MCNGEAVHQLSVNTILIYAVKSSYVVDWLLTGSCKVTFAIKQSFGIVQRQDNGKRLNYIMRT